MRTTNLGEFAAIFLALLDVVLENMVKVCLL